MGVASGQEREASTMMKRTNDELADALDAVTEPNYVLGIGDRLRVRAAAEALRAMPEGERIEVFLESGAIQTVKDFKAEARTITEVFTTFKMLDSDESATLVVHERKESDE
jgi:hypothetical protein